MNAIKLPNSREHLTPANRPDVSFRRSPLRGINAAAHGLPASGRMKKASAGTVKGKIQNFSFFAPEATSVQLVGCFTQWSKCPIRLRKRANGLWWTALRLERGTYYYRFLVDGQWRDDPECPLVVPNPFGSLNAVRQVY